MCARRLEFSTPYIWWNPGQMASEVEIVQLIVYGTLTLTGSAHIILFIYDAFG